MSCIVKYIHSWHNILEDGGTMTAQKDNSSKRVRLDEIIKSLFCVSKEVLIQMMNSLFGEDHDIKETEITFENGEFVTDGYDIILVTLRER